MEVDRVIKGKYRSLHVKRGLLTTLSFIAGLEILRELVACRESETWLFATDITEVQDREERYRQRSVLVEGLSFPSLRMVLRKSVRSARGA